MVDAARGVSPWSRSACSDTTSIAADASLIWLATAAVMRPPSRSVGSERIFSQLGSRGPSSRASPATGTISRSKRPSAVAVRARSWEVTANASMSSRVIDQFSAIMSAPRNWLTSWSP